jgi:DNA replication and repair protein RecF
MFLKHLSLNNFRLFPAVEIEFNHELNVLSGMNGQGKTSILEAIHYLALTRSFRVNEDSTAIRFSSDYFDISAQLIFYPTEKNEVRVYYSNEQGKNYFVNGKKVITFTEVIGMIPCVISTGDDLRLIFGAPADRRKFIDIVLSQTSSLYLQNLKLYRRILQQRNSLLNTGDLRTIHHQMSIWNEQLIDYGTQIIIRRLDFVDFLNRQLGDLYSGFTQRPEQVQVVYKTDLQDQPGVLDRSRIADLYARRLEKLAAAEYEKRITLTGPNRDDLEFIKNERSVRQFCSIGESKIFALCLKFSEWKYLLQNKGHKPIMLLDDVFGELDNEKGKKILALVREMGQSFITTSGKMELSGDPVVKNYVCHNQGVHAIQ